MPHLHIKEFKEYISSSENEEIYFGFIAKNISNKEEKLIMTKVEGIEFFLLLKEQDNRILLKMDKVTKPSTAYISHKALLEYAKRAKLDVLSSNVVQHSKNIHIKSTDALKNIEFFANGFNDTREIRVEVGFGSGRHLLHQAIANPDILFIGLEIHTPSIEQVLKQINIQNIKNIYILDYDARLFMELLPSNSVGKIYVHFPVPWDKKPTRRVISEAFILEAKRVLMLGGKLELRSDSDNYYNYSYETMMNLNKIELSIAKNRDIEVSSKYEDRWKRLNKNIYDLTMINDEYSKSLMLDFEFTDLYVNIHEKELFELNKKIKRSKDAFVNFERVYSMNNGVLLRVAMGSYERPQSLYVIIKDKKASYFPHNPLNTKASLEAHNILAKALNG